MSEQTKMVFGIDLGTTYSAIATLDSHGNPYIIANDKDQSMLLASAVFFEPGNPEPIVGIQAKNQAQLDPELVIQRVKREIGKETAPTWVIEGVSYDPTKISALILKRIKQYAEEKLHCPVEDVVITCPAYFGIPERMATRQAGELAGFNVLNVINEPTAAALSYLVRSLTPQQNSKIMVYDLGGGTFDVTLFEIDAGGDISNLNVLYSYGDDHLGGADWDDSLIELLCERYCQAAGIPSIDELKTDLYCYNDIVTKAEGLKRNLSARISDSIIVSGTKLSVSREEFEEITRDKVSQTISFVQHVLEHTAVAAHQVEIVLLVGGSTKMPMIRNALETVFPGEGRVLSEDPDEAVAKGAVLAAALTYNEIISAGQIGRAGQSSDTPTSSEVTLANAFDLTTPAAQTAFLSDAPLISIASGSGVGIAYRDKIQKSFGPAVISGSDYVVDNLIFQGQDAPQSITRTYYTTAPGPYDLDVSVFENESADNRVPLILEEDGSFSCPQVELKVRSVGILQMKIPDGAPRESEVELTIHYGEKGLDVSARLLPDGQQFAATLLSIGVKTEEEMARDLQQLKALSTRA